jgi:hypothetical protein
MSENEEEVQTDNPNEFDLRSITGGKIVSDGGTAAHLIFDLGNGKQAVIHASIEDAPVKPEDEPVVEPDAPETEAETKEPAGGLLKGPLPDDLPGKAVFSTLDPPVNTWNQLRSLLAKGEHIDNIGPKTREAIDAIPGSGTAGLGEPDEAE